MTTPPFAWFVLAVGLALTRSALGAPLPLASVGEGWDVLRDERTPSCVEWDSLERSPATTSAFQVRALSRAEEVVSILHQGWTGDSSALTERGIEDLLSTSDPREGIFLVSNRVVTFQTTAVGLRLSAVAKELLRASPGRFRDRCGDGAVRTLRSGGGFLALLRVRGQTAAEGTAIASALQRATQVIAGGATLAGALESQIDQHFVSLWQGREGLGAAPACLDLACIETTARNAVALVADGGVLVEREVVPYAELLDPRENLPSPLPVDARLATLGQLAPLRAAALAERHRLELAERDPGLAPGLSDGARLARLQTLGQRLSAIESAQRSCRTSLAACAAP